MGVLQTRKLAGGENGAYSGGGRVVRGGNEVIVAARRSFYFAQCVMAAEE